MRPTWIAAVVAVGVILGVAIAGIPSRHHDAPLRPPASTTSTTSTTTGPPTTAAATPHPPSQVTVVVVNTGGPNDSAGLTRTLQAAGYTTDRVETDLSDRVPHTVLEYTPGYQADAAAVVAAGNLTGVVIQALGDSPIPSRFAENANVMVVLSSV